MPARPPRLKQRREFQRVAARGQKAARPGLVLQALPVPGGALRVGFTATKKLGNAVRRNRTKRRLREAARLLLGQSEAAGYDLVLIGREATAARDFRTLLGDLRGALKQAGVDLPGAHAVNPAQHLLRGTIHAYRYTLRPIIGCNCRFYPHCSEFGLEAVATHGALKGAWLTGRRILRCNPWHPGGYDPVPAASHPALPGTTSPALPGTKGQTIP